MSQQLINAGETGLVVRTKLNENFTELYEKKIDFFYGWGYQDFGAGVINSTSVTITANSNGTGYTFDSSKLTISNSAAIVRVADTNTVPYTGTTTLFSSKVKATAQTGDSITLSGIPHVNWGACRIYYYYKYEAIPIGYQAAPQFISAQKLDALDASFVTDDDVATNYVPYTGASKNLNLGVNSITAAVGKFTTGAAASTIFSGDVDGLGSWKSLSDAGIAPSSGSANYIQNQSSSAQTANLWITGAATFNSTIQATTAKLTNLTDNFLPKHINDSDGLGNSVFKDDGTIATIEQNSVQPFTSIAAGAVDNTLYLIEGKVGVLAPVPTSELQVNGRIKAGYSSVGGDIVGIGGSGYTGGFQMWKNTTTSRANIGLTVPGGSAGDDCVISRFNGSWISSITILNSNGNVGIGTTAPPSKITVAETGTASVRGITNWQVSNSTDAARMIFRKDRGTVVGTPAVVQTGDKMAMLIGEAYDGASYIQSAAIEMGTSGTVASTRVPSYIAFSTSTDATPSVLTEAVRIDNQQRVGIGTNNPTAKMQIEISSLGGTSTALNTKFVSNITGNNINIDNIGDRSTIIATNADAAFCSFDASTSTFSNYKVNHIAGYQSRQSIAATGGCGWTWGFYDAPVIQNGLVDYRYGISLRNPTVNSGGSLNNNIAVHIADQTTGTNNYSIYSEGGYNYFKGNVGVGALPVASSIFLLKGSDPNVFPLTCELTGTGANKFIIYPFSDGNTYLQHNGNAIFSNTSSITPQLVVATTGNVGITTSSPTTKLSISEKAGINELGGYMVKLTNKTGANSIKGTVVYADPAVDNAFEINPIDGDMPIGVVYENGIADGSECWVVVSGIAEVLLVDGQTSTRSYVAYSSNSVAGRIDISATIPAAATHFREIGHTLESKASGTSVLCKCILHFN